MELKLKEIAEIPEGESGDWKVEIFEVSEREAKIFNIRMAFKPGMSHRLINPGTYKRLVCDGNVVMSNTPAEIYDNLEFIRIATGNILINGLGLGVCLSARVEKKEINSVIVIEISKDVIKLIAPVFEKDKRIKIINADAFEWKQPKGIKYDAVWHDIWNDICGDNLEDMKRLHRKYGRRCKWQGSWCRYLCELYN